MHSARCSRRWHPARRERPAERTPIPWNAPAVRAWSLRVPFFTPPEPLSPHQRRLLAVLGATVMINHYDFGLLANVVAGRLADRLGRRVVIASALVLNALGIWGFYNLEMPFLIACWVAMMFCLVAVDVLFGALGSELFPTSFRSTASSIRALAWTVGGSIGLLVEGALFGVVGGTHGELLMAMLPVAVVAPLVIWLGVPETAARELEDIAPDRP